MKPRNVRTCLTRIMAMASLIPVLSFVQAAKPALASPPSGGINNPECADKTPIDAPLSISSPAPLVWNTVSPQQYPGVSCSQYWNVRIDGSSGRTLKIQPSFGSPLSEGACRKSNVNYYVFGLRNGHSYPGSVGGALLHGTWDANRRVCRLTADNPNTPGVETEPLAILEPRAGSTAYDRYEVNAEAFDTSCPSQHCTLPVKITVVVMPKPGASSATLNTDGTAQMALETGFEFEALPQDDATVSADVTE